MRALFLFLTAVLSFQACIPLNSPGASGNQVYVGNFYFTPVVDSGTANRDDELVVTFRWIDSASGIGHSVVFDSAPGALPDMIPQTFTGFVSITLTPGRYVYHCSYHENFGMVGVIVVVPFGTPTASAGSRDPFTQPDPEAVQASPRQAARRSQPATS